MGIAFVRKNIHFQMCQQEANAHMYMHTQTHTTVAKNIGGKKFLKARFT